MCRELGIIHPDVLCEQLTSNQIAEWEAYDRIDPIGKWRDEYQIAVLCSVVMNIANSLYSTKGKAKTVTAIDFMPVWDEAQRTKPVTKKQSVEEMKQILYSIARIQNSKKPERINIKKKKK